MTLKVVALGRTKLLYDSIKFMYNKGVEIPLIITCKSQPEYDIKESDFEKLAQQLGAEFICNVNIENYENLEVIKNINADIAISVNWKNILTRDVIDCFRLGILNCHIGDLPKYRGNAVVNWALINNEKYVTATIHKMDDGLDSGDIVRKQKININKSTTVYDILEECNKIIPQMFFESIKGIEDGTIETIKQSNKPEDILRCYPRVPFDSLIDWKNTADCIDRLIRASSKPFAGAYTYYNNQKIYIQKARVEKLKENSLYIEGQVLYKIKNTGEVVVGTGNDAIVIEEIRLENGKEELPANYIKSVRSRLGMQIDDEIHSILKRLEKIERYINEISIGNK